MLSTLGAGRRTHRRDPVLGGATLTNPGGYALRLDRATVEQDTFFQDGFTAHDEVHLGGAHIHDLLALQGMTCRDGFIATGQINLVDARFGYLDMSGELDGSSPRPWSPG